MSFASFARNYDLEVSLPDAKTIRALLRKTKKEVKSLEESISDREALKITLSGHNLTALISVMSALFLASGYLYSRAFLGHFGVDVAKYFALSDYNAASIEGIRYSIVAAVAGSLGAYLRIHSLSRMSYVQAEKTVTGRCDLIPPKRSTSRVSFQVKRTRRTHHEAEAIQ